MGAEPPDDTPDARGPGRPSPATTMRPCRACGSDIDPTAPQCPECGNHPAATARRVAIGITAIGVAFAVLVEPLGLLIAVFGAIAWLGLYFEVEDVSPTKYDW